MRSKTLLTVLALAAVALAGCSDGSPPDPCKQPPCETIPPSKGAVAGVVVDDSITPVADAVVAVVGQDHSAQSDADGRFLLNGLDPGPHFITVSKPGYRSVQQGIDVVEGTQAAIKVLLEADPENRPYFEAYTFEGFIECGAGLVLNASTNPCFVSPNSVNVFEQGLESTPTFVQAEMVWEENSVLGSGLQYSFFVPDDSEDGADDYAAASGTSPLLLRAPGEALEAKAIGAPEPLQIRVFPAGEEPTVHANQGFQVFVHAFYKYQPPDSWRFSKDPTVPGPA